MLDANPGTTARPPGLRNLIPATAGQSVDPIALEAMKADLKLIATTLAPIAGNSPIILIASPAQAWALKLLGRDLPFQVLMSSSIAAGEIIGIAANALVTAVDPTPRFEVVDQGVVHLDDSPAQIGVAATPNVVAAKTIDLWQSDCLAVKCSLSVSWALRNPGGLCWLTGVAW